MTTIAYKDGVIACDGRITSDDTILTDSRDKRAVNEDGVQFFVCGKDDATETVVSTWPNVKTPHDSWNAFVVDGDDFWLCGSKDGELWKCRQLSDEPMAIGSGSDHAFTAMDMGCSAQDAVHLAAKRDTGTGGQIREYKLW